MAVLSKMDKDLGSLSHAENKRTHFRGLNVRWLSLSHTGKRWVNYGKPRECGILMAKAAV